jgi:YVTN family beta-propeller protein
MLMTRLAAVGAGAATMAAAVLLSPGAVHASGPTRNASTTAGLRPGSVTIINTRTNKVSATVRVGLVPNQVVITPDGKTAYVLNSFSPSVTQIKVGRSVTSKRVKAGSFPLGLAITPDGKKLYISRHSNTGPGSVLPVNVRTGVPGRPVNLPLSGGDAAGLITVVPDGSKVLAAEFLVGNQSSEGALPIRTATNRPDRLDRFGRTFYQPTMMAVTPDSRTAFVLSIDGTAKKGDLLTPIRIGTGTVTKSLVLPSPQVAMTMTPNGRFIYLADYFDGTVTVVRTATNSIVKRIHVSFAFSLAMSPDGKTVYAGGANPITGIPEIVTIATASNKAAAPILFGQDGGVIDTIAITPDGRTVYFTVSSTGNFIVPLHTATKTLGPPIRVGPDPMAIAIARHGSIMYVVNSNNAS